MRLALLFAVVFLAGAGLAVPQDEDAPDTHVACDNSKAKDTETRYHNCECNRSTAECDREHPKPKPEYGCKTYCKEDHCDCGTRSCS